MTIQLSLLRVGSRVKLRGPDPRLGERVPNKPYPLGWRTVHLFDGDTAAETRNIVVAGDERWLPVTLVTEIKNGA